MFWDFEWLLKFTTKSPFFSFLFSLAGSTALFIAWISSELPEPIKTRENCNPITRWIFLVCGCSFDFFFRPTIGVWTVLNWLLRFDSQKSSALFVLIRVSLSLSLSPLLFAASVPTAWRTVWRQHFATRESRLRAPMIGEQHAKRRRRPFA